MADTIEVIQGTATVVEVAGPTGPQGPAGAAGATGAQGPQGVPGTGLEVLTTQGDLLYQGASTGERLPIGTTGQVLKVAGGIPSWANESGAVTSVNGATGAVVVAAATHAEEHEPSSSDTIYAFAALVTTDVLALNGVYFCDGATTVGGKDVFFKTGTRKNTKLQYNSSTVRWELIRNTVAEAEGDEDNNATPWGQNWQDPRTPAQVTSITVARVALETMVQKLAETGGTATATTSEDGLMSFSDKTKLNGIASGAEVNVQANWTEADSGSDAFIQNKPATFAPSAHSSSHAVGGSDPLAPSDIGAQSIFSVQSLVITTTTQVTLTAARAKIYDIVQYAGAQVDVKLPSTNAIEGDIVVMRWGTGGDSIRIIQSASGSPITTVSSGEQKRFIRGSTDNWTIVPVDTHTHAASAIVSGTVAHERGGLEADVSAYSGLVKISGGSTSAVTVTSAGEALLDDANAAAQRTTLGLGTAATAATGDFAAASHSHELTALAATGATNGHVLTANGSNGVTFAALPASGVSSVSSSASDVLGVSGANITGVDAGSADRLVFWDDSASKLTYLEAGSGLSISGTTLTATASGGSKTYAVFTAEHNQPPSTAFATLDTRGTGIAVLDFDAATDENAVFVGIMPEAASLGSGLIVRLHWMATSATSGNVRWGVQFERSNTDLDADSFDTAVEATAATNGTSGILTTTAITVTTIDGITAGDVFRLKVFRNADDATNDTMTGDAELVAVEVRSAA